MAQLTSDIVWLVEREVTLPNGVRTKALVPQVYVRTAAGDLHRDGTLLSAAAITLHLHGDLVNGVNNGIKMTPWGCGQKVGQLVDVWDLCRDA